MKYLLIKEEVKIPEEVIARVKSRVVTIKGEKGKLQKSFKFVKVDIRKEKRGDEIILVIDMWMAGSLQKSVVKSIASIIKNMIKGVTRGFKFRMRFVYCHFPFSSIISAGGRQIELRNFLGCRESKTIYAPEGVQLVSVPTVKNVIEIQGIDLEKVSQTCASIQNAFRVVEKDRRKFIDGIYVCAKGFYDTNF